MKTIIGLGNPGKKYEGHRHNIGFQVLNRLTHAFEQDKYAHALVASYEGFTLVQPQTFMNESGKSAQKFQKEDIIVVYDDIDIPLGTVKCSFDRGAGGHNGVQSIIDHLGTTAFARIRVGVRPVHEELFSRIAPPDGFEKFLLSDFAPQEHDLREQGIKRTIEIIEALKTKTFDEVMNQFNHTKNPE